MDKPREINGAADKMRGSYLGPRYEMADVRSALQKLNASFEELSDGALFSRLAQIIADGRVVGWFQGAMEFGPRALGGRSIIGDPRSSTMQSVMNLKIKYRESFRPFAPAVLAEHVGSIFEQESESPYMLIVAQVKKEHHVAPSLGEDAAFGIDKLKRVRSNIPAVTHVDHSARIQTVHKETNPKFHALLTEFYRQSGCPVLVNTSFNVRGEPIVRSPEDAYRCFMRTEMDYLVVENCLLFKGDQPDWKETENWRDEFELD